MLLCCLTFCSTFLTTSKILCCSKIDTGAIPLEYCEPTKTFKIFCIFILYLDLTLILIEMQIMVCSLRYSCNTLRDETRYSWLRWTRYGYGKPIILGTFFKLGVLIYMTLYSCLDPNMSLGAMFDTTTSYTVEGWNLAIF